MKEEHLYLLACPETGRRLHLKNAKCDGHGDIVAGLLCEPESGNEYPIAKHIPRFVPPENYAESFGFQWKVHARTQHDAYSGVDVSGNRFRQETKWGSGLDGEVILEAGSGAGRFTPHALATGAMVVSFDCSNAVESHYKVEGQHERLLILQADIYKMPFRPGTFDKAYCFGVLQHTPDPETAFYEIVKFLRLNGRVASDIYLDSFRRWLHIKTWARPFLTNYEPEELYQLTKTYVDLLWPLARLMRRSDLGQKIIARFVPDASEQLGGVDDEVLKEWAYLDTFDWVSPVYDDPQTVSRFRSWHEEAGLVDVDVHRGFNGVEGRGTKSAVSR